MTQRDDADTTLQGSNPVLKTAYAVVPVSTDVTLNAEGIHAFANSLVSSSSSSSSSSSKSYTSMIPTQSFWAEEPLHPIPSKHGAKYIADWILMVSLLNFSFWSELAVTIEQGRYAGLSMMEWMVKARLCRKSGPGTGVCPLR